MERNKIKVVHIITSLDVGGAERMLSNLVLAMDRKKYENIVISLKSYGYWGKYLKNKGITVYALNMKPTIISINKLMYLWYILRKIKPDYLQGWLYHANVIALFIGKLSGVKRILWNIRCSAMDLSKYNFTTKIIYKIGSLTSNMPYAIINNSRASIKQHKLSGYNNKHLLYIPNGFDLSKFKPNFEIYTSFRKQNNFPENAKLIGMFARFDPMKDHATFIHAAGILARQNKNVYFILAGKNIDKNNKTIHNLIQENNLITRTLLLGQIENLQYIYPAMDYITQTSNFGEGFPNVIGEAMACGIKCFCTDVGDSLEIIGNTGYKIPKKDPYSLSQKWQEILLKDKLKYNYIITRNRISQNYSLTSVLQKYYDVYSI